MTSEMSGPPVAELIIGKNINNARLMIGDLDIFKILRVRSIRIVGELRAKQETVTTLTLEIIDLPQRYDLSPASAADTDDAS